MKITKKTEDRIKAALPKFQKVLGIAKDRDLNESDTVSIITDILAEVFGYDKYLEVTSELAIRGTYCDLAIKLGDKFQYLIECKAIGTDLKEAHLRQALGYGANKGIEKEGLDALGILFDCECIERGDTNYHEYKFTRKSDGKFVVGTAKI